MSSNTSRPKVLSILVVMMLLQGCHQAQVKPVPNLGEQLLNKEASAKSGHEKVQYFQKAIQADPSNPYYRLGLQAVFVQYRKLDEARSVLQDEKRIFKGTKYARHAEALLEQLQDPKQVADLQQPDVPW